MFRIQLTATHSKQITKEDKNQESINDETSAKANFEDPKQRTFLFWDTLPQRGNNYIKKHLKQGAPPAKHGQAGARRQLPVQPGHAGGGQRGRAFFLSSCTAGATSSRPHRALNWIIDTWREERAIAARTIVYPAVNNLMSAYRDAEQRTIVYPAVNLLPILATSSSFF